MKEKNKASIQIATSAIETSLPIIDANNHRLTVSLASESLPVDADPTRLAQVLSNLLNNAAKYTPSGGHVTLSAARETRHVVIRVIDTGIASFVFEITGKSEKVEQFIALMVPLGLVEVARTGVAGITRGPEGMKE